MRSALPQTPVAARFPCLTTGTPNWASSRAARVLRLAVEAPSPPVPTTSMASAGTAGKGTATSDSASAKAASSWPSGLRWASRARQAPTSRASVSWSMKIFMSSEAVGSGRGRLGLWVVSSVIGRIP